MSRRLQVLIPDELDARVRKTAARRGLSVGAWVRRVIEDAFRREQAADDPIEALAGLGAPTADIEDMLAEVESGRS